MVGAAAPRTNRPWYRRIPAWAYALAGVVLLLILLLLLRLFRQPTVTVAPVVRGQAVAAVYAPGTVLSGTQTAIAATAGARVVSLYVQRGSTVTAGQLVAQLDATQPQLQLAAAQRDLQTAQAQYAQISQPGDPYEVEQARARLAQAQADYRRALDAVNAARAGLAAANSQVRQATAEIRTAQSRVTTAQRNVRTQQQQQRVTQSQVGVAQAQVRQAQAQLANARDVLRRQQNLFAQGAVSERNVVEAQTAVQSAEANLEQARANVTAVQQQVDQAAAAVEAARSQVVEAENAVESARGARAQAIAGVANAEAEIEQATAQATSAREAISAAQANLSLVQRGARSSAVTVARTQVEAAAARVAQAQDALSKYTIRSLVRGTVSDVPVDVGDYVPVGGTIATIVSQQALYVQADVDESDIGPVRLGQTAYFTTDALPDRTFQGVVSQIGASADPATNTYPVDIRNIMATQGLRVNLTVDVNIVTARNPRALLIPATAVVTQPAPHVWVVDISSRIHARPVTIGARDTSQGRVEVRTGLVEGEQVVTNPQADFREGQRVRIVTR